MKYLIFQDEESVKFGLDRIATAALRSSKFIYGDSILVGSSELANCELSFK